MKKILIIITLLFWGNTAQADIVVIVNAANSTQKMSKRQVTDLFMGSYVAFPNGSTAIPIDQPVTSKLRTHFYKYFTGKSIAQINAYWAKLIFSGRATPPRVASASESIVETIAANKNTISYIDAKRLTKNKRKIKVVYTIPTKKIEF